MDGIISARCAQRFDYCIGKVRHGHPSNAFLPDKIHRKEDGVYL